jgi:DNA-directed RNA polymerase subunit beta
LKLALVGKTVAGGPGLKKGAELTDEYLDGLGADDWFKLRMADEDA